MNNVTKIFIAILAEPALYAELMDSFDLNDHAQLALDAIIAFADEQE